MSTTQTTCTRSIAPAQLVRFPSTGAATGCRPRPPALIRSRRAFPLFLRACRLAGTARWGVRAPAASRLVAVEPNQPATAAARIMSCMEKALPGRQFTAPNRRTIALRRRHRLQHPRPRRSQRAEEDALLQLGAELDAQRKLPGLPETPPLACPRCNRCARLQQLTETEPKLRYDKDDVLSKESVVLYFRARGALWSGFSPRLRGENAAQ